MGILYIVATPIGNLKDITFRALEILKEVDLVVCEDTRQTIKLLNHYRISKPLVSYFQHSKLSKIEYIIGELEGGKKIALVSDAGTPGISDPGGKLVEQLLRLLPSDEGRTGWGVEKENTSPSQSPPQLRGRRNSVTIIPIPGPNAAITALSVSGFPTDKFIFMGFPPHKKGREKFFREVAEAKYTVVFYESSHRILKALEQLKNYAPDKNLVVCRELTKMFESIYRGSAEEIIKILESDKNNLKGEFVVIVNK